MGGNLARAPLMTAGAIASPAETYVTFNTTLKEERAYRMKLYFTQQAYAQLVQLIQLAIQEISGWEVQAFGRMQMTEMQDGEALPVCTELSLPPQVSKASEIDSNVDELVEWQRLQWNLSTPPTMEEIEVMNQELPQWRLWIHTHGKGSASYSSKDVETLGRLAAEMSGSWFLGLVINDKLEHAVYIGGAEPAEHCAVIINSRIEVISPAQDDAFATQFKERVEKWKYETPVSQTWRHVGSSHSVFLTQLKVISKDAAKRGVVMGYETTGFEYELRAQDSEQRRQCVSCKGESLWSTLWKRAKLPLNAAWSSELGPAFICLDCGERGQVCECDGASEQSLMLIGAGYGHGW